MLVFHLLLLMIQNYSLRFKYVRHIIDKILSNDQIKHEKKTRLLDVIMLVNWFSMFSTAVKCVSVKTYCLCLCNTAL